MNGVINPGVQQQRYFVTSDVDQAQAFVGDDGRFGYCQQETLEILRRLVPIEVKRLNKCVKERIAYPHPVTFNCASGSDHIILWFERSKDERPDQKTAPETN